MNEVIRERMFRVRISFTDGCDSIEMILTGVCLSTMDIQQVGCYEECCMLACCFILPFSDDGKVLNIPSGMMIIDSLKMREFCEYIQ